MDWKLVKERENMVDYLRDLIIVRKKMKYNLVDNLSDIKDNIEVTHLENGLLLIKITDKKFLTGDEEALIFINPTEENVSIDLDDYYRIYLSSVGILNGQQFVKNFLVPGLSLEIVVK